MVGGLATLAALLALVGAPPTWERVKERHGVTVWQRGVEGTSLVEFRGRGEVEATVLQILAVLGDHERKTEWMDRCTEARGVRLFGMDRQVVYQRIGSDIPLVSDRDVVMEAVVRLKPEARRVQVDAVAVDDPLEPPRPGVVRMPELRARWTLEVLDAERTLVTYEVRADPGGDIPKWVVNLVSRSIPAETIERLRQQTAKGGYEPVQDRVRLAFDWAPFGFEPGATPPSP